MSLLKVVIFGTGGLSHQISGPRAGLINSNWDTAFLDNLSKDPKKLTDAEKVAFYDEWAPFVASSGTYEVRGHTIITHNILAKRAAGATAEIVESSRPVVCAIVALR